LNNIASVDATTAASISAAGVGGGGTLDFTATGAIASGDVVGLRSDGTVEVISGTSQTESLGTRNTFNSSNSTNFAAVFDATNNKVVVAITDQSDSSKGKAFVGTVSGTSISFGTAVQFSSAAYYSLDAAYDPDTGQVIIVYGNSSGYGTAIVGSVSGTSISFGTATVFASYPSYDNTCCYDTANSKVIATSLSGNTSSNRGQAFVGTVSGTSISFGSPSSWYSGTTLSPIYGRLVYDPDNEKPVIIYRDANDSRKGKAKVGTVSGTSISWGTEGVFQSTAIDALSATYDTSSNKIVVAYRDDSTSPVTPKASVGTVSGTSISFGTAVTFDSWVGGISTCTVTHDPSVNKVVIFYTGSVFGYSVLRYVTGTVSGTSITFNTPVEYESVQSNWIYRSGSTYDANAQRVVVIDRSSTNSAYPAARVLRNAGTISNNDTWIGISTEAISNAATGTVTIVGGVNEQQTGLTTGSTYYVAADGSLSTTDSGYKVGKAISATKILITEGN
jgi:hypothetical protein